jgi:membrane protein implicated in regulation of membrane protease activity
MGIRPAKSFACADSGRLWLDRRERSGARRKEDRAGRGSVLSAARASTNPERTELGGDVLGYFLSLTHIGALAWLAIGIALCAAETLAPGAFLVWIGASAAIVGVFAYLFPIHLRWQLLMFGALVVVLGLIGRRVYRSIDAKRGPPSLNKAQALIGEDFVLDEAIVGGYGSISVGESSWRVAGADCPSGAKVRVVAVEDDSLLRVERV